MSIIYVLIPIAMIFVAIAVLVFFWAVKSNQYEDLDREAVNILFDEDVIDAKSTSETNKILSESKSSEDKSSEKKDH
ncbi:cbb3-type cytochrome oxidase assembly protein CcoS [Psychromonas algicola]|uniref:cbb3-type cytochrome oxidase assembly protein CcoS n=1 Tax=Psychromonas algicola TaxID=2555642 RepID=UPI001067E0D7|nr:cbb3-type cytochrome oxidase assembly protein CcoS [Psychromonas sp. RZ5]TEW52520.1 cbb3-type cytochrome oxidase assembly protein CcoS [Psychromonas sp. RZ5]